MGASALKIISPGQRGDLHRRENTSIISHPGLSNACWSPHQQGRSMVARLPAKAFPTIVISTKQ